MNRLFLAFLVSSSLAGCGPNQSSGSLQAPEGGGRSNLASDREAPSWRLPDGLSKADEARIEEWAQANEGCVGGNVAPDDAICKKRDALQDRLRQRGWCWGAPLSKSASDNDWHRCGDYDSDTMSNAEALIDRGRAALSSSDGDRAASDWFDEKQRPKSALLEAYENAIEPIDDRIGLAEVLAECGIRGSAWRERVVGALNARKHAPSLEEMRQRLTPAEALAAQKFSSNVVASKKGFALGGQSQEAACRSIATAPFVTNDNVFQTY